MEGGAGAGGGGRCAVVLLSLLVLFVGILTLQSLRSSRSPGGQLSPQRLQTAAPTAGWTPSLPAGVAPSAPLASLSSGELPPFESNCSHPLAFVFSGECSGHRYLIDLEILAAQIPTRPPNRAAHKYRARAILKKSGRYYRGDHIPGIGHVTASYNLGFKLAVLLGLTYISVMPIAYGHSVGGSLTTQFGLHSLLSVAKATLPRELRKVFLPQDLVGLSKAQNGTEKLWLIPSDPDRYRGAAAAVAAEAGSNVLFELGARTWGTSFAPDTHVDGEYGVTRWLLRGAYWRANRERLRADPALCSGRRARVVVHWRTAGAFDSISFTKDQRVLTSEWLGRIVSFLLLDMRTAGDSRAIDVVIHHQAGNKSLADTVACPEAGRCNITVSSASAAVFLDDVATADVLVATRSGLSQVAALLGKRGQIVVYAPIWHSYEFAVAVSTGVPVAHPGCVRIYGNHLRSAAGASLSVNDTMGDPPYDRGHFVHLYRRRYTVAPADSPCSLDAWCSPSFASWPAPPARGRLCEARRRLSRTESEAHYTCG